MSGNKSKKIECVIVSVNYADILAHTLPQNKTYFSRTVVVTDTKDKDTKRLCEIYGVECVKTDVFYHNGKFDKGSGITEGLKHLGKKDWVLQLDADIWLHPQSMKELYAMSLNSQNLYGCDRIMIESFKDWQKFISMPDLYVDNWLLHLSNFKIGSRITQYWQGESWQVLGFFQLWNPLGSNNLIYPTYSNASKSDIIFSSMWSRYRRVLIPEVLAVHLENGKSQAGTNWDGRKSKKFGI